MSNNINQQAALYRGVIESLREVIGDYEAKLGDLMTREWVGTVPTGTDERSVADAAVAHMSMSPNDTLATCRQRVLREMFGIDTAGVVDNLTAALWRRVNATRRIAA